MGELHGLPTDLSLEGMASRPIQVPLTSQNALLKSLKKEHD